MADLIVFIAGAGQAASSWDDGQVRPPRALMSLQRALITAIPSRLLGLPEGLDKPALLAVLDAGARADLRDALPRIHAPTVVLCGSADRPNLPAARQLARGIEGAELRIVPRGGHALQVDAPGALVAAVRDAITRGQAS